MYALRVRVCVFFGRGLDENNVTYHTQELDLRGALGAAFCLRHRMQHFLENYIHYMLFEVGIGSKAAVHYVCAAVVCVLH